MTEKIYYEISASISDALKVHSIISLLISEKLNSPSHSAAYFKASPIKI